jgi:hypothetical protein
MMQFLLLILFIFSINLSAQSATASSAPSTGSTTATTGAATACGLTDLTDMNTKVGSYTKQIVTAATTLNAIINGTSPTASCQDGACTFDWSNFDFGTITNFAPIITNNKKIEQSPCTGSSSIYIPKKYTPFGTCNKANCTVQCGDADCSIANSIVYQMPNYYGTPDQSNNGINYNSINYLVMGCQCATPELSLEGINHQSASNPSEDKYIGYSVSDGTGNIIIQCPLCENFYQANNNIILLKYEILKFIQTCLSNKTISSGIKALQQKTSCSRSTPNATTICSLNPSNLIVLPPKKKNVTIEPYYTADNKIHSYCLLVDMNKQITVEKVLNYLAAISKSISQSLSGSNLQDCESEYEKIQEEQQKNVMLNEQITLLQQKEYETKLQTLDQQLGIVNQILGLGMFAYMFVPEKIQSAISETMGTLIENMKSKVGSLASSLNKAKASIPDTQEQLAEQGAQEENISSELKNSFAEAIGDSADDEFASNTLTTLSEVTENLAEEAGESAGEVVGDALTNVAEEAAEIVGDVADVAA